MATKEEWDKNCSSTVRETDPANNHSVIAVKGCFMSS